MLAPFTVLNGPGGDSYVIPGPGQVHRYGFAKPRLAPVTNAVGMYLTSFGDGY